MTDDNVSICAVCAWRETCQKKFSISGRDERCADFTKDLKIADKKTPDKPEAK